MPSGSPPTPLDLLLLQTFLTVVQAGSMRAAAGLLHVSQPAVTARVREFERHLGTPLFERSGRQLVPTAAGRVVLEHSGRLLAEETALRERLVRLANLEGGRLSLATIDAVSIYVLPEVYLAFRSQYPGIELHVHVADSRQVLHAVREREVEIGVLALPPTYPRLKLHRDIEVVPIYRDRMICVVAPTHALASRRNIPIARVAREPLVLYDAGSTTRAILDAAFEAHGWAPNAVMETASPEAMRRLAQVGVGIAVLPAALVEQDLRAGTLVHLQLSRVRFQRTLATAVRRGHNPEGTARRFLELVYARWPPLVVQNDKGRRSDRGR